MTLASIDIGTNTVLLLVARMEIDGSIIPLVAEQRVPRLGRSVDQNRNLHPASMGRVIAVLQEYQAIMAPFHPTSVTVCGTSALRDASNREEFSRLVRKETRFSLEVLSGEEEAEWTYRGAISGVPDIHRATVVDIGGGSTEIIIGDLSSFSHRISLNIGSVRLTERYFKHDPPTRRECNAASDAIRTTLAEAADFPFEGSTMIGVAGTATSLALLVQKRKQFDLSAVTNYRLSRSDVEAMSHELQGTPSASIRELSEVMEGRADVITAGSLILQQVMEQGGFEEMIVSERGVRYGLLIREAKRIS
jgi:exopolyphosphatase/guanosine-5'-triphosphate,3'-diphosphate pyrophosphatase